MERTVEVKSAEVKSAVPLGLPRTIWYMGAKTRVVEGFLDEVLLSRLEPGQTLLDLFSGSGLVAAFAARRFRVIANDVQRYACLIARGFIERPPGPPGAFARQVSIERDLLASFERNRADLCERYAEPLHLEEELLGEYLKAGSEPAPRALCARYRSFLERPGGLYGGGAGRFGISVRRPAGAASGGTASDGAVSLYGGAASLLSEESMAARRADPRIRPACLITGYYQNVYYGLRQAIELDSLRAAIDDLSGPEDLLERKRVHYLSVLLHAASVTTSGTSHFAQPRSLEKDSELEAMARRRRIDVLATFRRYSDEILASLEPLDLHPENLCLSSDSRDLITGEGRQARLVDRARADLVYMDPPYTSDNYSRFYHVLEVLARYHYPPLKRDLRGLPTAGRYPEIAERFQSDFCRRATVEAEFSRVIAAAAGSGAKLVISYGSPNGLLLKVYRRQGLRGDPVESLERLCGARYAEVEVRRLPLTHSGQGDSNISAEELLLICDRPR
jgi:adenine-specific DNA methylase